MAALSEEPVVITGIGPGLGSGFIDVGIAQWIAKDANAFPSTMVTSGPADWVRREAVINPPKSQTKAAPKRGLGVTLNPPTNGSSATANDPTSAADPAAAATAATAATTATAASGSAPGARSLAPVVVSNVVVEPTRVRFHVDRIGVPVLVRISWFPNWEVEGGSGPYRAMPNYMVVIPTRNDVTLNYGKTTTDHLGMAATVAGLIGLVALRRKRGPTSAIPAEAPTTVWPDLEAIEQSDEESVFEPVGSPRS